MVVNKLLHRGIGSELSIGLLFNGQDLTSQFPLLMGILLTTAVGFGIILWSIVFGVTKGAKKSLEEGKSLVFTPLTLWVVFIFGGIISSWVIEQHVYQVYLNEMTGRADIDQIEINIRYVLMSCTPAIWQWFFVGSTFGYIESRLRHSD